MDKHKLVRFDTGQQPETAIQTARIQIDSLMNRLVLLLLPALVIESQNQRLVAPFISG